MKKIFFAVAMALVIAGCCPKKTEVAPLKVVGTQLTADGKPVAFRGISFGWHNIWPRFYNKAAVKQLSEDTGCRIFRAAIGSDDHALADNPGIPSGYIGEPEFALEKLYAVIDGAIENGCYVIVDWHSHTLHLEAAKEFFAAVATRYKGVPNIIYELFNEPVCFSFEEWRANPYEDLGNPEAMTAYWLELKRYASELIKVITDIDPSEPLILMGCPSWDQRVDLPAASPIEGYNNIMYTMHFYAATHKNLREACDAALAAGIPIFVSECAACEATGDGPMDLEEWEKYSDWATEKGITMMAWSISDKVETCSMFTKAASSEGPWSKEVIKPWGKIVKDWILETK